MFPKVISVLYVQRRPHCGRVKKSVFFKLFPLIQTLSQRLFQILSGCNDFWSASIKAALWVHVNRRQARYELEGEWRNVGLEAFEGRRVVWFPKPLLKSGRELVWEKGGLCL